MQLVAQAAEQRLIGVRVRINEAGQRDEPGGVDYLCAGIARLQRHIVFNRRDARAIDGDRRIRQNAALAVHRDGGEVRKDTHEGSRTQPLSLAPLCYEPSRCPGTRRAFFPRT